MNHPIAVCWVLVCCLMTGCDQRIRGQSPADAAKDSSAKDPSVTAVSSEPAETLAADAQAGGDNQPVSDLEIDARLIAKIVLDGPSDDSKINFDEAVEVVLTNHSDESIRIWNPKRRQGYYQWSFEFVNSRTGKAYRVPKRTVDEAKFWRVRSRNDDSDRDIITLSPNGRFTWFVNFKRIRSELPTPNSSDLFNVTLQFASVEGPAERERGIWTGTICTELAKTRIVDPRIRTPLDCLRNGYPDAAIEMMERDPKLVNTRDGDSCAPLHHAARFEYVDVVRWLLDHGADVNAVAQNNLTPLHMTESPDVIRLILEKRPKMTVDVQSQTPLQHAAARLVQARGEPDELKWREIVKLYEDAGIEIDILTAIHQNDFERVKTILKKKPAIADDFQGQSPLRTAASLGRLEICRSLIENYVVDVDDFERGYGYPIIKGALAHPLVVQLLIAHGADLKTRITFRFRGGVQTGASIIRNDATLLHYAACDGVPETIRLLIDNGVDIFATAHDTHDKDTKQTALDVTAIFGKGDNAEVIINHTGFETLDPVVRQAVLDRCLVTGAPARGFGRDATRVNLVKVLLEKGANPSAQLNGRTALQMAAHAIHPTTDERNDQIQQIVNVLMSHGATLDFVSAVALGKADEVQRLLQSDPKLANSRRSDGYPALHIAVGMNDKTILQMLLAAGCDVDIRSKCEHTGSLGETALRCAAFWRRFDIAELLIAAGADVNALTDRKSTPLHDAARMGHVKLARLLLEHGANPDAEDKDRKTPLDWYRGPGSERCKELEELFEEFQTRRPN